MARIAFDMSNVLKRSLLVGVDKEFGKKVADPGNPEKTVQINGWQYGFDNAMTLMITAINNARLAPRDVIMVFEGMQPKAVRKRKAFKAEYKANRGTRPPEFYVEFKAAKEAIEAAWLELGAASCVQNGVEADDVLAWLAKHTRQDLTIWSHDGDLAVLLGTNQHGARINVGNNDVMNQNPFGDFDPWLIRMYKTLVGDTSDNIKGAYKFGDAAFLQVLGTYGAEGLSEIERLVQQRKLEELQANVEECRPLRRVVESAESVYESYALACLYPDEVNTLSSKLNWKFGLVRDLRDGDDTRLRKWYGKRTLVGAHNLRAAVVEAANLATGLVGLDLETTSSEDSDAWLERRKRKLTDEEESKDLGIDVFGQELVSCGITVGDNGQHTYYFTHRHSPGDGIKQITQASMGTLISYICEGNTVAVHNANFEIPVLGAHFRDAWRSQGFGSDGLLPNVHCTKILASYVDENQKSGLKPSAKLYLDYDQETFEEVTTLKGVPGTLLPGGKSRGITTLEDGTEQEARQYKMHELTASHVFSYGSDDPLVTTALYHHWKYQVELEGAWDTYVQVEQDAMYPIADSFIKGIPISLQKMRELEEEDNATFEQAWGVLRGFLLEQGWEGTVPPDYSAQEELTAAQVKEAYTIVTGKELKTQVRKLDKLASLIEAEGADDDINFASMLQRCTPAQFTRFVQTHFKGEPVINFNSTPQMQKLMYDVMKLPVRVSNKVTDAARLRGETQGTPKTDELAIQYALRDCAPEQEVVLQAIRAVKMVETRRKLYYKPYANIQHWKDQKVHASVNQSATNTRRFTASSPNVTQLPKHPKATGEPARFREVYVPHKEGAVIVSFDFQAQELRVIADYSRDPGMLACYDPDNPKDMHAMTGIGIMVQRPAFSTITYDLFMLALERDDHELHGEVKVMRALGKKTNFTTEFGAQAKKLAQTLLCTEAEAQAYIDAKLAAFPEVEVWKQKVIAEAQETGISYTKMGAVRHLRDALLSDDRYTRSKADRQAVNFRVQSSSAEQTKLAMGRMWRQQIFQRFDSQFYFPVHDEIVASVSLDDLVPFVLEMHACMCAPYADMVVPIESSVGIGWNFGDLLEIGARPTKELLEQTKARLLAQREPLKEAA